MTQYYPNDPYGQQPLQYGQAAGFGTYDPYAQLPLKPTRPGSVTAIAIIAIIFSAYAVLCAPFGAIPYVIDMQSFMPPGSPSMNDAAPEIGVVKNDPLLFGWMMGSLAITSLVGLIELVGGIASLKLKPIGRTLLLTYAWCAVVEVILGLVFNFGLFMPRLAAVQTSDPAVQVKLKMVPIIAGGASLLGLILPICVIYFFNRPHVKAAFAGQTLPPAGEAPSDAFGQPPAPPSGYPSGYGQ